MVKKKDQAHKLKQQVKKDKVKMETMTINLIKSTDETKKKFEQLNGEESAKLPFFGEIPNFQDFRIFQDEQQYKFFKKTEFTKLSLPII